MEKTLWKSFMENNYKRQIKESLELKKVMKKGNKLCVNWKSYDNSFNRWINKKRYHCPKMNYYSEPVDMVEAKWNLN